LKETIAITGATGHVGTNLIRILIEKGYHVRVLVRKPLNEISGFPVEAVVGDLSDELALLKLCHQVRVVVHAAAMISIGNHPEREVYATNVTGTQNVINACKKQKVARLIHFSSVDAFVMHGRSQHVDEQTPLDVHSPITYKRTKALGEQLALDAASSELEVIVLSPAAIMGPYDDKPSLIGQMLIQMHTGKLPFIVPGGYRWVDVRDVCEVVVLALHSGKSGEKYILAGEWVDLTKITRMLQPLTAHRVLRGVIPFWLAYVGVPFIVLWSILTRKTPLYTFDSLRILHSGAQSLSSEKARLAFGFSPRPFADTLHDTIQWFAKEGML
jgi:dihydroflavonol-4-reductase